MPFALRMGGKNCGALSREDDEMILRSIKKIAGQKSPDGA
jgi:hypothetical protein